MDIFQRVYKFNEDAGTSMRNESLDSKTKNNEIAMLQEELNELNEAFKLDDRVEIADALGDIIYVAMGTMGKLGLDYNRIMDEICKSNETKYVMSTSGKMILVKNEAGKIIKGENFKEPDLNFCSKLSGSPLELVSGSETSQPTKGSLRIVLNSSEGV